MLWGFFTHVGLSQRRGERGIGSNTGDPGINKCVIICFVSIEAVLLRKCIFIGSQYYN